ncbi:MAG: hypothetical protein U0N15_04635 [Bifidobacterium choerinum]
MENAKSDKGKTDSGKSLSSSRKQHLTTVRTVLEVIGAVVGIVGGIASVFIAIYANDLTKSIYREEGAHYMVTPLMQEEVMTGMGSTYVFDEKDVSHIESDRHKQILPVLVTNTGRTQGTILEMSAVRDAGNRQLRICMPAMDDMGSRIIVTGSNVSKAHGQFTLQPNESKFLFLVDDDSDALDAKFSESVRYKAFTADGSNPVLGNQPGEVAIQVKEHYLNMNGYKEAEAWCLLGE